MANSKYTPRAESENRTVLAEVIPLYQDVDYDFLTGEEKGGYQQPLKDVEVCSPLFYTIYVNPDGDAVSCCITPYAMNYGNIHREDLVAIWNGVRRRSLLELHLKKARRSHSICKGCVLPNAVGFPEDVLDDAAEEMLSRIGGRTNDKAQ